MALLFPSLRPVTVEHPSEWQVASNDEALLAQAEAELELKWNKIRNFKEGTVIGKTTNDNDQEEYEPEAEEDEADNVEEESDAEEFEQEAG